MKKIFRHSFVFISCEMISKAVPFLMLPYLTRVINLEGFGQLGLFTSLQALAIIFVNFSFEGAVARYFYKYGKNNFPQLILHSIIFVSFLTFFWLIVAIIWNPESKLITYAIVAGGLQAAFNIISTSKQCQKKVAAYSFYQIGFSLVSVLLTLLLFKVFEYTSYVRIMAILSALLSFVLIFLLSEKYNFRKLMNIKVMKINFMYLISFGAPLIIHQSSLYIKGQLDRLVISHYFSLTDLAFYTAAFQISSIANVVIMACNKALVPYYFEACKKGIINIATIRKLFFLSIPLSILPGIALIFLPDRAYEFVLGSDYSHVSFITAIFTIGFGIQIPYLILVNYLFYLNETNKVAYSTFFASMVHLAILFILKDYDLKFLPFSMIISNTICIVLLYFNGVRKRDF